MHKITGQVVAVTMGALFSLSVACLVWADQGQTNTALRTSVKLPGLKAPVEIYRDRFGIPHIYAASTEDAYFALGYLHATDRLFQMELFRRRASGRLAEIFGRPALEDAIFVRQIGIRRSADAIWKSPQLDTKIKIEIAAYCAGVNARIRELEESKFPVPFRRLGLKPAPWTPVDALAFPKYMGWDQSGTDTDVWMGMLVEKFGVETVEELFPLDRPYEIPTVADAPVTAVSPGPDGADLFRSALRRARTADPQGLRRPPDFRCSFPAGFTEVARELHRRFVSGRFGSNFALGSNNWAIDGTKSATGKPLLANDPHLGFQLPSIWYSAHLVAPGLNISGVTFAGFPYTVIGHNDRIAWGLTNMQADAVDYFIEKTDPAKPRQYFYKGEWRDTSRIVEEIPVRGEEAVRLEIESTVHGPLVTSHGVRLALSWTGLGPTFEVITFQRLNLARNLADFKAALKDLTVPALNVLYADADGNIAIAPHGALPIRKRGNGRWPVEGSSGDYDWAGFIPDDQLPYSVNPPQHYLASANGRPAPVGYPYYLGWMWDASYRTRRIHELLRTHEHITLEEMQRFQLDAHDSAAEAFVPVLIAAYDRKPSGGELVQRAIEELRRWNFQATPESVAPTIWTVWFKKFREAVWQDEFERAGVEPWPGSWGYSDTNARAPVVEVLEFLTKENPASTWFDDVRTPEKESRDDILARSLENAIEQLSKEHGKEFTEWQWGKTNVLRLLSATQDPANDRGGQALRGDNFTLAPGGGGGPVTGGASWRMVVDFSNLANSVGMYPGGQSEDPANPHYDDQVQPWAEGRYLPMLFFASPREFQSGQVESILVLNPM